MLRGQYKAVRLLHTFYDTNRCNTYTCAYDYKARIGRWEICENVD